MSKPKKLYEVTSCGGHVLCILIKGIIDLCAKAYVENNVENGDSWV